MMCGYRSYTAIAECGRTYHPNLAKALGFTHTKTPCAATLHYVFKDLDATALEDVLSQWAVAVLASLPVCDASQHTAIAIDGKTGRGSLTQQSAITHLLSIVSHQIGITLIQQPVEVSKNNEIPIAKQILQTFDVSGKIVTTDALLTQKAFCQILREKNADYVGPVKANQKQTDEDIRDLFTPRTPKNRGRPPNLSHTHLGNTSSRSRRTLRQFHLCQDKHGFRTTRTLTTSTLINDYLKWPGLAQVDEYRTQRKNRRTGKVKQYTQYGITRLPSEKANAQYLLELRRGHWTIENLSHRTRDVTFREDASQVRCGNIPQVLAALRNTVITLMCILGHAKIEKAQRFFAAHPWQALEILQNQKLDN